MTERQVFFVCGAPKSGTTWLQRLLDAHPEIHCFGEGHFIERFSIPLAGVLRDYVAHMDLVSHRVYEGKPYHRRLEQPDLDSLVRHFILERLTARDPGPEVRWLGDKTPRYTAHLDALLRIFPAARFINIVRDPRDVAVSRIYHAQRAGFQGKVARGTSDRIEFFQDAGSAWAECVRQVAAFKAVHPECLHNVRYEDLIADTAGETSKFYRFLGVADDAATVAGAVEAASFETLSGRKPGQERPDAFMRKGVVGDWRGQLEPSALSAIQSVCGELMRDHRYARSAPEALPQPRLRKLATN